MEKRVWAQERRFEINIKRKRTKNFESKRKMSYLHYVDINGEMRQVCLQFLASTVNVSRRFFVYNVDQKCEKVNLTNYNLQSCS